MNNKTEKLYDTVTNIRDNVYKAFDEDCGPFVNLTCREVHKIKLFIDEFDIVIDEEKVAKRIWRNFLVKIDRLPKRMPKVIIDYIRERLVS